VSCTNLSFSPTDSSFVATYRQHPLHLPSMNLFGYLKEDPSQSNTRSHIKHTFYSNSNQKSVSKSCIFSQACDHSSSYRSVVSLVDEPTASVTFHVHYFDYFMILLYRYLFGIAQQSQRSFRNCLLISMSLFSVRNMFLDLKVDTI
jgi:hypothetical protein